MATVLSNLMLLCALEHLRNCFHAVGEWSLSCKSCDDRVVELSMESFREYGGTADQNFRFGEPGTED